METCKYQIALQPELWVLGKLDPAGAAELEEHLMTCEACQEAVEAARGLRRGLALVAAEGSARPLVAASPSAPRRRWLAAAALLPLAAGALLLARHEQISAGRLAAAQSEVARLDAAARELQQAGARDQQGRQVAEQRGLELERQLAAARERPALVPAAAKAQPLIDLPTFLLAVMRDRPAGPDLVLRRSELGEAYHLALDLPDPSYTRFRVEISSGGRDVLARRDLAPSALDALLLTLPADFLPEGESRLILYGQGPGKPEQQLASFRIAVEP